MLPKKLSKSMTSSTQQVDHEKSKQRLTHSSLHYSTICLAYQTRNHVSGPQVCILISIVVLSRMRLRNRRKGNMSKVGTVVTPVASLTESAADVWVDNIQSDARKRGARFFLRSFLS